jgi:S1-C subfamily serine protease
MKNSTKEYIAVALVFVVVGVLGLQSYLVYDLRQDLESEMKGLENSLGLLEGKLSSQKVELKDDIETLRGQSTKAISDLGGNIDVLLKENSKSQKAIEKLSEGLEELENVQIKASKDFSSIVEDIISSVVSINAGGSLGSGVFVSPEYLITNYHVVEGGENDIKISTVNGESFDVELIGFEPNVDVAVLKYEGGNFPFLELEDMGNVNVGEGVVAVGSPLGLSFSVTQGIVSSKSRTGPNGLNIYLQTDAPINPGNSGGPLVNLDNKIVAINTWKIGGVEGLGFSIRSDTVKEVYEEIINQG